MGEVLFRAESREQYETGKSKRLDLLSTKIYGFPKKRGKWEWVLLVWFTLVLAVAVLMGGASVQETEVRTGLEQFFDWVRSCGVPLFIWLLLASRRFRAQVSVRLFWNIAALIRKLRGIPFCGVQMLFYEDYLVIRAQQQNGQPEVIWQYSAFDRVVREKGAFFLYRGAKEADALLEAELTAGTGDELWQFLTRKMNGTVEHHGKTLEVMVCHGQTVAKERPVAAVKERPGAAAGSGPLCEENFVDGQNADRIPEIRFRRVMDETAIEVIADYAEARQQSSSGPSQSQRRAELLIKVIPWVIFGAGVVWYGVRSGDLPETAATALIVGILVLYNRHRRKRLGQKETENPVREKIRQELQGKGWQEEAWYRFFEDKFCLETSRGTQNMNYSELESFEPVSRGIMLVTKQNTLIYLCEDWLEAGTMEKLQQLLAARLKSGQMS